MQALIVLTQTFFSFSVEVLNKMVSPSRITSKALLISFSGKSAIFTIFAFWKIEKKMFLDKFVFFKIFFSFFFGGFYFLFFVLTP